MTKTPELYRHYKGGIYEKMGEATLELSGDKMVLYRDASAKGLSTDTLWVRTKKEFNERFIKLGEEPLKWSKDLPSIPGVYLQRAQGVGSVLMNVHTIRTLGCNLGYIEFCGVWGDRDNSGLTLTPDANFKHGFQWYGPIPQ